MEIQQTVFFAIFAFLVAASSSSPNRDLRHVQPDPTDPMTLRTLHITCTVQGWTLCQDMTRNLLDSSHQFNTNITDCIANKSAYEIQSIAPSTSPAANFTTSVDNSSSSGSGEGTLIPDKNITTYSNDSIAEVEKMVCTVSGNEKKRIRKDVYCRLILDIDQLMGSIVRLLVLYRDLQCVPYYTEDGYLTPHQILNSIHLWHQDMIDTHKKCCESPDEDLIFTRNLGTLYGPTARAGENAQSCNYRSQWVAGLTRIGFIMRMLEHMQSLGRRKTCLRGCVGQGQVFCSTYYYIHIFAPYPGN